MEIGILTETEVKRRCGAVRKNKRTQTLSGYDKTYTLLTTISKTHDYTAIYTPNQHILSQLMLDVYLYTLE